MRLKPLLFFLFLITLSSLALAQGNPFEQNTQIASHGLSIIAPRFGAFPQNTNISVGIHIYNSTGYTQSGDNVSCELHLYNKTGGTFLEVNITPTENDYAVMVGSGDTATLGTFHFVISCESLQGEAGFISSNYEITQSGNPTSDSMTPLVAMILAPLILAFLMLFGGMHLNSETHGVLKIFLFLFPIIPYWTSIHFSFIILAQYYNFVELQNVMSDTVLWTGLLLFTFVSYFMIYTLIRMFERMSTNKEKKLEY